MAYDIIILAGQSNAEGTGIGPCAHPYTVTPDILCLKDANPFGYKKQPDGSDKFFVVEPFSFITEVAKERPTDGEAFSSFALFFASRYIEEGMLEKGRKLLIIQSAAGGTGFAGAHWGLGNVLHRRLKAMLDTVLSDEKNKIVAFLWHQGEYDAVGNVEFNAEERYDYYLKNLAQTVSDIRKQCDLPSLPFLAAEFVSEWKDMNAKTCDPILKATEDFCKNDVCAGFVHASDLKSNNQTVGNNDTIHFSRQSLYILGNRYFDKFKELIGE